MKFSKITAPTPADVLALRSKYGLTQTEAAELVYVTLRAWQKWENSNKRSSENCKRQMDRRTWELLLYKLGELTPPLANSTRGSAGR